MPVKRRMGKAHRLDEYKRYQLLEGPDAVLLAGVGYLAGPYVAAFFDQLSEDEQSHVLAAMRDDWQRFGAELTEWWRTGDRSGGKPWLFYSLADPDSLPWAAEEFGEPRG